MLLQDKVAIVTGAGSGIGRASAVRFAAEGAAVVVADIRLGKASETVELIEGEGGQAVACQVDVASSPEVARMVATALDAFGTVDALFNNAGTIRPGTAVSMSEDWDLVMAVNVRSVFLGAKHAVPVMAANGGGAIVSTASVSGLLGDPSSVVYSASKAAVINLARALAVDHAEAEHPRELHLPGRHRHASRRPHAERPRDPPAQREGPSARPHRPAVGDRRCRGVAAVVGVVVRHREALVVDGGLTAQSHMRGMNDPRPAHLRN
jgi:NADP-dependent 3-hydroxy acid dehydrogenase YdfG